MARQENETGEWCIAAAQRSHLLAGLADFQEKYDWNLEVSEMLVCYREGCCEGSSEIAVTVHCTKHIHLYREAFPVDYSTYAKGEREPMETVTDHSTGCAMMLRKYWGGFYHDAKPKLIDGFLAASHHGPLTGEPLHLVYFDLKDLTVPNGCCFSYFPGWARTIDRDMKRLCHGAMLLAEPQLLEPIYATKVLHVPFDNMGIFYKILSQRRGHVYEEIREDKSFWCLLAYIPVRESFGLAKELHRAGLARVRIQNTFERWEPLSGSPYEEGSLCQTTILELRRRKGLSEQVPVAKGYLDR